MLESSNVRGAFKFNQRMLEKFCNVVAHKKALVLVEIAEEKKQDPGFDGANFVMENFLPLN